MPEKFRNEILHVTLANEQVDAMDASHNEKMILYWRTGKGKLRKTGWILREWDNHGDGKWFKTKNECYAAMFAQIDRKDK